jgi:hypothetical protein
MHFSLLSSILALATIASTHAAPAAVGPTFNLEARTPKSIPRRREGQRSGKAYRMGKAAAGVGAVVGGVALLNAGLSAVATGTNIAAIQFLELQLLLVGL